MASKEPIRDDDALRHVADKVPPAPGGTLAEFVEHLHSTGQPAILAADGREAWVPGVRHELMRLPMLCTSPVEATVTRELLRHKGIWVVSYLLEADEDRPANCFAYVCRNRRYHISELPGKVRNKIRRGLRNLIVRLCTLQEIIEKGYPAEVDTAKRHGHDIPSREELIQFAQQRAELPFYDFWGAWRGDELVGWMCCLKVDDWALIEAGRSCTEALKLAPNNAIRYAATRQYMVEEKRSFFQSGVSSLQSGSNLRSLHEYKTKMRFEPVAMHRVFVPHPLFAPLLRSRIMSWGWDQLARAMPKSMSLAKLAGMSRLLSGREKSPLSWAE